MPESHCTYICPIRCNMVNKSAISEFREYWKTLDQLGCEVLVVDGSPPEVFETHDKEWLHCRHIKVDQKYTYLNGKVNGIMTAVPQAKHEKIILADDDVRYDASDVQRTLEGLEKFDVVRPQNYFHPLPFWTRLDAARILLNRAFLPEGDFPGTFGFLKSVFEAAGPFDGDVLFDNEELIKHLQNFGARICYANDFFILRKPPAFNKWLEQRPRQAYEDFVMKEKSAFFLSLLPLHLLLGLTGKRKSLSLLTISLSIFAIHKAWKARKKEAGKFFPVHTPFYAPLWLLERSISVYIAIYWKLVKGGYPFGDKIIRKGTGVAWEKTERRNHTRLLEEVA